MPPSKRRNATDAKVKKGYRELLHDVSTAGDAEELSNDLKDARISSHLNRVEDLFNVVKGKAEGSGPEMAMDASVIRHISRDIKDRVEGMNVNKRPFKFSEFATKVAGLMNTEKDEETKTFREKIQLTKNTNACCNEGRFHLKVGQRFLPQSFWKQEK